MKKLFCCLLFTLMLTTMSFADDMEFTNKLFGIELNDELYTIILYNGPFSGGTAGHAEMCSESNCWHYLYEAKNKFITVYELTNFYYDDNKLILINHDYYEVIEIANTN